MLARLRSALMIAALAFVCGFASVPRLQAQAATAIRQEATQAEQAASGESEDQAMRHSSVVKAMAKAMHLETETAARLFELINFAVLAVGVIWFLRRVLPKTFAGRVNGIQKNLMEARTATESANIRLAAVEERLSRLDTEIGQIRTQAEQDAAQDEQRIKAAAEEDKAKVIAAAEQEIAAATAQAQRQIRRFAAEMVIEQATQRLQISADLDRQLIEEFAGKLLPHGKNGGEN